MLVRAVIYKILIRRVTFLLALFFLQFLSVRQAWPQQSPAARIKVACIGNSITYGDGIQDRDRNSYPAQLQRMLGPAWDVRNFGVSGRTLLTKGDYPYRQTQEFNDAKAFLPDVVVIKLGTNDTKPQNWKYGDEFEQDYLDFVEEFRSLPSHPRVFLCYPVPAYQERWGIRDSIIRNELIPLIDTIAAKRDLPVIDLYSKLTGKSDMFPDGIHPDARGAGLMARAICGRICPACASKLEPEPFGPIPSRRQLGWESLEYCAFIHFNMNSFTDREWGDGA